MKFISGEMSRRQASQVCVLVGGCNNKLVAECLQRAKHLADVRFNSYFLVMWQ